MSGISIGALNAALVAGNPPERRVERLRSFWELVSSQLLAHPAAQDGQLRTWFNETSAILSATFGVPGLFEPRLPPAVALPAGCPEGLSVYSTNRLREALGELVDFDLINRKGMRLSVGAVNARTGYSVHFDNFERTISTEHIMASAALPPGLPPIEIDGEAYWDGGLVSNSPLQYVLDVVPRRDMSIFQVDLFSARGAMPQSLADVAERMKDIRYSSRTRLNTDAFCEAQIMRRAVHRLLAKLPPELKSDRDATLLSASSCDAAITIVHLIYRGKDFNTPSKDFEFSRHSIEEHWEAGRSDAERTLRHEKWRTRPRMNETVTVLDLGYEASE